jgi:hypothetical protein
MLSVGITFASIRLQYLFLFQTDFIHLPLTVLDLYVRLNVDFHN